MTAKKGIAVAYAWHLMWLGEGCAVPECACPHGRFFFADKGPWIPSPDRYLVPGIRGGTYDLDNIRLTHQTCNKVEGGKIGGTARSPAKIDACRQNWSKANLKQAGNNPNSRNLTHADQVRGGDKGRCTRWFVGRGKPCICGEHFDLTAH